MRATYNITNDQLKAWFDERLSSADYEMMKRAKFRWWPGSKCFCAKWNPEAEDALESLGIKGIEEDDRPDDVESRVERFQKHAENAEESAANAQQYLEERANTERRRNNAINSIEKNLSEAEHWQSRIEGAIRHAQYKERPDVIARRIRGLETDLRRQEKQKKEAETFLKVWQADGLTQERALAITNYGDHHSYCFAKSEYPNSTYEGSQSLWGALDKNIVTPEQARDIALKSWNSDLVHAERWIKHLKRRIEYEMALLKAAGGCDEVLRPERKKAVQPKGKPVSESGKTPEPGGAIGFRAYFVSKGQPTSWRLVTKVNRTTIDIVNIQEDTDGKITYFKAREPAYRIVDCKTAEQVKAEMPDLHRHWQKIQGIIARNAARKAEREQQQLEALPA